MKKITRILAAVLAAAMLAVLLAACAEVDPANRGAHIHMYLGTDPTNINFDPQVMMFDAEAVKWVGLMFQGLTVMDYRGRVAPGMAESWEIMERDDYGVTRMHMHLKETSWDDGVQVSAEDFVFAFERVLQPDFHSHAASLLFDIKNARQVKEGYSTVADLGLAALDITLLEITFERGIDHERFLRNLASIVLVPVRMVPVSHHPLDWAWGERSVHMRTNGPFTLFGTVEFGNRAVLERNIFYMEAGDRFDRFVRPHRLYAWFNRPLDTLATTFDTVEGVGAENIFFLSSVPGERAAEFSGRAQPMPMLSSYAVHFNTGVAPFDQPEVRRALSMALDRGHIASLAGSGFSPATGFVPEGAVGINPEGDDFRAEAGQAMSPSGDEAGARALLPAGATAHTIELTFRDAPAQKNEIAVAEYIAEVWRRLGFTVNLNPVRGRPFNDRVFELDFGAILHDYQSTGVCAWSALAPFAMPFSGSSKTFDPDGGEWIPAPFYTGFHSPAYDALMEEIFLIDDNRARNERLRDAERMLVNYMPIAPLFFNRSMNISDDRVRDISFNRFGFPMFARANLRNYLELTTTVPPRVAD